MTPVEIIALILIIVSAIKIITILVKPQAWVDFVKKLWVNPMVAAGISLILAAVVLYYLLQELTIIQILATMAFLALLAGVGIGIYAKEVMGLATKMLKKGIMKKAWFYTLIWIVLILWGAKELFM